MGEPLRWTSGDWSSGRSFGFFSENFGDLISGSLLVPFLSDPKLIWLFSFFSYFLADWGSRMFIASLSSSATFKRPSPITFHRVACCKLLRLKMELDLYFWVLLELMLLLSSCIYLFIFLTSNCLERSSSVSCFLFGILSVTTRICGENAILWS